jgi:peroxiredoxin
MCLRQLAEFRERCDAYRAGGFDIAAISVDEPTRAEAMRRQLQLPFPVLCDTRREVARSFGVLEEKEKGGIARPAVFVIDRDRRLIFRSLGHPNLRVHPDPLLAYLRRERGAVAARRPRKRLLLPRLRDWFNALRNTARFGTRSPNR